MIDGTQMARRYLLGELTEAEQAAHEEAYFNDPRLFAEVAAEENALIDEYVRGRLAPELRQRFESAYLSRPERRARVEFAEALLARIDAAPSSSSDPLLQPQRVSWLSAWFGPRLMLAATALAAAIVVGLTLWIVLQSTRPGPQSQQAQTSNGSPSTPPEVTPGSPVAPALSIVTLSMTVGAGQRSPGLATPTTLELPVNTDTVRFALTLRERDYGRYRIIVRLLGGDEVLQRGDLRPSLDPSSPTFTIDVPASTFTSGDYMLTLQGATSTGEFDDLSQSLFRVRQVR